MEPLSVTASIIAILQVTTEVVKYINEVKDAPEECQQCATEASNLQSLLIQLLAHTSQSHSGNPWFSAVQDLTNGPLDQYCQTLKRLREKTVVENGAQKLKQRLTWKFSKAEIASILSRMERLKSLVVIALELDSFKLSQVIQADIKTLQDANNAIKDDTTILCNAVPSLQTDIQAIQQTQSLQWDAQQLQQHNTILSWLSPADFPAQQHDIISRKQEGTGQWFLDSPVFKRWQQGEDRTLFCPGIPGAGKTMISAIAIDYLCRTVQPDVRVAYVFCNYKAQTDHSASALLAALLKQLVQAFADMASPVACLYEHHSQHKSRPSQDEIIKALDSVCAKHIRTYIVIDALDECSNTDGARSQLINTLNALQTRTALQLLFTSRFIPEITERFRLTSSLEVRASEDDVRRYVVGQIPRLPRCIQRDEELERDVCNGIVEAVDGMFLLARLHVESLRDKLTKRAMQSMLNRLLKGSAALSEAYREAFERIDGQLPGHRLLARHALSWITYAQRPLTTTELCHALAIEPDDRTLNEDSVYDVEDVVSVCGGLIIVDEESNIVRLIHYTTQEYLERVRSEWIPNAQETLARACLTYLSLDEFRGGSCSDDKDYEQRKARYVFLGYSAQYWSEHVRPVERTISSLALAFLNNGGLVDCTIQAATISTQRNLFGSYSQDFPSQTTGLHLIAMSGLLFLAQKYLDNIGNVNHNVNSRDEYGRTALTWAAEGGHEAIVRLLVERDDVEADSKDEYGQTPLSRTAEGGHEAVVRLLVERDDVEADSKDEFGQTPLWWAAEGGHEAIVRLLVERDDVEADSKDKHDKTPLSRAAEGRQKAVVRLLMERDDVEADSKDKYGQTSLSRAAVRKHEAIVRLLVERDDVEAHSKDKFGRTPQSLAALLGYKAVV